MATKTIGTGGDYTSHTSYLTYLQTLGTLTAPEIGQRKNDELVFGSITYSGFTPTSSNRWTLETEAGASFRDNANKLTNALRYNASNGAADRSNTNYNALITVSVPYATVRNLQLKGNAAGNGGACLVMTGTDPIVEYIIAENLGNWADTVSIQHSGGGLVRNILVIMDRNAGAVNPIQFRFGGSAHFCTFGRPTNRTAGGHMLSANYNTSTYNNCVWIGFNNTAFLNGGTVTGANNATDQASYPGNLTGQTSLTATTEFEQPSNASGTMDFRLKSTSTVCKDNGTTDSTNGAADIIGTSRPQGSAYDIGAWELVAGGGQTFANPFGLLGVGRAA